MQLPSIVPIQSPRNSQRDLFNSGGFVAARICILWIGAVLGPVHNAFVTSLNPAWRCRMQVGPMDHPEASSCTWCMRIVKDKPGRRAVCRSCREMRDDMKKKCGARGVNFGKDDVRTRFHTARHHYTWPPADVDKPRVYEELYYRLVLDRDPVPAQHLASALQPPSGLAACSEAPARDLPTPYAAGAPAGAAAGAAVLGAKEDVGTSAIASRKRHSQTAAGPSEPNPEAVNKACRLSNVSAGELPQRHMAGELPCHPQQSPRSAVCNTANAAAFGRVQAPGASCPHTFCSAISSC